MSCSVSSVAPPTYYINNLIYQELISEDDYFDVLSDERICLDLRASSRCVKEAEKLEQNNSKITLHILLEEAATKKLRLRVWAHALGKYLYILTKNGLTLRQNICNQSNWQRFVGMRGKQSVRKGVWNIGSRKRRWKRYRKQRGRSFPIGLLASAAAPFLGEIAKPILKKVFMIEGGDDETKNCT